MVASNYNALWLSVLTACFLYFTHLEYRKCGDDATSLLMNPVAVEWRVVLQLVNNCLEGHRGRTASCFCPGSYATDDSSQRNASTTVIPITPATTQARTHVAIRPSGFCFPLLSTFVERERGVNTTFGKVPVGMNESENLLRSLDKVTKLEVDSNGARRRMNAAAKLTKSRKKSMLRSLYLHDIHHTNRPLAKERKRPAMTWTQVQSQNTAYKEGKLGLIMHNLHDAQVDDAKQINLVDGALDPGHKKDMQLYAAMKNAKKQDEILTMLDNANMMSLPQEIDYLVKSKKIDEGLAWKFGREW